MKLKLLASAATISFAALPTSATHAAVVINLVETAGNVVATTSGAFDLSGLTFIANGTVPAFISPYSAGFLSNSGPYEVYSGVTGPTNFGDGPQRLTTGIGDSFGFVGNGGLVAVPNGYLSNTPLAATTTFAGQTFSSLGATPGTYLFSTPADSITFNIGSAISAAPEPGTWAMMLMGFGIVGAAMRRRSKVRTNVSFA
jgi:hypothetical protein